MTSDLTCVSCRLDVLSILQGSVVVTSRIVYFEDDFRIDDFQDILANETSQRFSDAIFGGDVFSIPSVAVTVISFPLTFSNIEISAFDDPA